MYEETWLIIRLRWQHPSGNTEEGLQHAGGVGVWKGFPEEVASQLRPEGGAASSKHSGVGKTLAWWRLHDLLRTADKRKPGLSKS